MPRVTHIAVNGLRVLADVRLDLHPLNVLIGENGSGKSSLVEACELLRKAATSRNFVEDVYRYHAGRALFRNVPGTLTLEVMLEDGEQRLAYRFALSADDSGGLRVDEESLVVTTNGESSIAIGRDLEETSIAGSIVLRPFSPSELIMANVQGPGLQAIERTRELLASILVYLPLDTSAPWARRESASLGGPRGTVTIRPAISLDRSGDNLPNVYHTLRNRGPEMWNRVLDLIRLGLGDDMVEVSFPSDPGGGHISLALQIRDVGEVSSRLLSDGQLAYLSLVAILMLTPPTFPLIVFDEPDHHLHPGLLQYVVSFFEELSETRSVVVTTHSDRLIDHVTAPADSVVLLSAPHHQTIAQRPDRKALAAWLGDYRGLGSLRADGVASMIFPPEH